MNVFKVGFDGKEFTLSGTGVKQSLSWSILANDLRVISDMLTEPVWLNVDMEEIAENRLGVFSSISGYFIDENAEYMECDFSDMQDFVQMNNSYIQSQQPDVILKDIVYRLNWLSGEMGSDDEYQAL